MYAAEAGFTDEQIFAVVKDADDRWKKYTDRHPTDRLRQLINIVDRARRKHPYGTDDVEFGSLFSDETPLENAPKIVFNFGEFMEADVSVEWQLENLFPRMGYGIIYGMPGVGKTLIGMDLANCLVFGQDWMAWKNIAGPQSVLFLSLEMNHPTLKLQYSKMTRSFTAQQILELNERLHIAPLAETIPLDTPEGRQKLESFLIQYRPNVLFIDSLSETSYQSLLDDNGVRELNRFLRYIREHYVCSVYIVHHDRKSGATRHQDLDSMWGSRFISSAADFILFLENTEPESDQIWMVQDKNRLGTKEERFLIDRDWVRFSFTHGGNVMEQPQDRIQRELMRNGTARGRSLRAPKGGFPDMFGDVN